jgi:membrane protein required for beta-lactamase induction
MKPGGLLNWMLAAGMLATALFGGLARRITLRDGSAIDGDTHPRALWMFVGGCTVVGIALLIEAALNVR